MNVAKKNCIVEECFMTCFCDKKKNTEDMPREVFKKHDSTLHIWVYSMTSILLMIHVCAQETL